VTASLSSVHPRFQTPGNAILAIGAGTLVALFLGDSLLVPVTEVGSASSAFGWLASCVSFFLVVSRSDSANGVANSSNTGSQPMSASRLKVVAAFGALAASALVLMKFLPMFPGHFTTAEYVALGVWLLIGLALRRS